jgi:RNA polymerase sigma-70 factor (ECF subfamily)
VILVVATMSRPRPLEDAVSDAALLARFARGDAEALGEIFDRHQRATYRFLARLTSAHAADLDDLVQAVFVEVARGAKRFDGRSAPRTWIFGIAVNVARHHVRGAVRRRRVLADPDGERPSQVPGRDRPDQNAEHRELLAALDRALAALPAPLRETFVACEIEELSGAEAAKILGVAEGTVFRRLHEARKALRAALEAEES